MHFLGFRSDAAALLQGFYLFALPSISEVFSISTIETMASGIPVIVTRSGGLEKIVTNERDGLMVQVGSEEQLAKATLRLTADPMLQHRLAANAIAKVNAKFTLDRTLSAYEALYAQAFGQNRSMPKNSEGQSYAKAPRSA